jgi:stage II sporulation protein M
MQRGKVPYLPLFIIGLVLGVVLMNAGKSLFLDKTGLLDESSLYQMKYMTIDSNALFLYVLWNRLKIVLFLLILATTYLGVPVVGGAAVWYGFSGGMYLSALVIRYGMKGIFFALTSIFPQYLIYIPAMLGLLLWCEKLSRSLYTTDTVLPESTGRAAILRRGVTLLMILAAFLVGCLLESYVNPYFLSKLLKVF